MDFGDYIYIILAIVFSVVGAMSKKRKAKNTKNKPPSGRGIFEELFDMNSEVEDPIPQTIFVDDEEHDFQLDYEEVKESPTTADTDFTSELRAKLDSLYAKSPEDQEIKSQAKHAENHEQKKHHSLIKDLHNSNELRKAVVYAEVMQRKF